MATVKELRRSAHVKAIYDCTVGYSKGGLFMQPPSFWETIAHPRLSDSYEFHVHVERHPIDDLPEQDSELAQWLEDRWIEKDQRLEQWKQNLQLTGRLLPKR